MRAGAALILAGVVGAPGCAKIETTLIAHELGAAQMATQAYSGETMTTAPTYSYYLAGTRDLFTGNSDPLVLSAHSDSACSAAAAGQLKTDSERAVFSEGKASFTGTVYSWPVAAQEGSIYLKAASVSSGLSVCAGPVRINRRFNSGSGFKVFGSTGAAGGTGTSLADYGYAIQVDSEGRYVVAGSSQNWQGGRELALWRFMPDGSPDKDFGGDGAVTFGTTGAAGGSGVGVSDAGLALVIDAQGRYVVGGTSKNSAGRFEAAIWRFLSTGSADTSFGGGDGAASFGTTGAAGGTGTNLADEARGVAVDSQGRYLAAGKSKNGAGATELALWRFSASGSADTAFGGDGAVSFGTTGAAGGSGAGTLDVGNALAIDSQGRYVVVGSSVNAGGGSEMALWRFQDTGAPDTSFGGDGAVNFGTTGAAGAVGASCADVANALAIDSQGRIIAAGRSDNTVGGRELALWRFSASGAADTGFGGDGAVNFGTIGAALGAGASEADEGLALAIDSQGRYVVSGTSKNAVAGTELALWRYSDSGSPDTTFSSTGAVATGGKTVKLSNGATVQTGAAGASGDSRLDAGLALVIDSQGRYVVAGTSKDSSFQQEMALWRYLSSGSIDK